MNASRRMSQIRRPIIGSLLALAVLCLPRPLKAQSVYGQVLGRLTSSAGAPVSGASVNVTSEQTGARTQTMSDAGGYYAINNLTPDLYQIDIQAFGYSHVRAPITVSADSTTTVDVKLEGGAFRLVLGGPAAASGSTLSGKVAGRLVSPSGAPISVSVILTSVNTGARVHSTSDAKGDITIPDLAEGPYKIEVRAEGYKSLQDYININADEPTTVDVPLQPGNANELAQKTEAGASVLKLDRTDVSTLFDARSVNDLPLLDRNLTELQLLVPGAALGQLFILPNQNPQNGRPVNINGQLFSGNAFQIDGTEDRDPLEGIVVINPTLDSVGEMKVTTQGYNAEFGEATAGVATIQTKSGSNAWHQDAFGYRRTGWGQSQDPFALTGVPPSKYNIFGGSLGGPIIKNKLFIFGDYQGTRSSQGADELLSVPPDLLRRTCLGSLAPPGLLCDLSNYSNFISGPLHNAQGQPYPNNEIPNTQVSDQAVSILALLPPPNHSPLDNCAFAAAGLPPEPVCNNYLASGNEVFSGEQFDVRNDYNASSRLRLFGRYSFGEFYDNGIPAFGPGAGGIGADPSRFAGIARTRNQGLSTGFTYSLGPRLLTDFRLGYFRYRLNINAQDYGQTPTLKIPGIFAADTGDAFATGLPDFEIPGQAGLFSATGDYLRLGYSLALNSCSCPLRERERQFQLVNNWTRSTGRHIVKWGADLRFLQNYRLTSDRPPTGSFSFSPAVTGLGLATFLLGDVTSFSRAVSSPAVANAGEHQKRFGFYGQDTWRINSRLTLNYGLRWEIYFPQTATGAGGFLVPGLSNHDPATTYFSGPPSGGVLEDLTNCAPRLGFAYLINPTTVVRVGYGRSFDAGYGGNIFGIAATQNPPVTVDQTVQGSFNLAQGPPPFIFPAGSHFSLLDIAQANAMQNGSPASGPTLYALPSRVRVPTVDSWNLTFQHELTSHLYFELAYVGDRGTRAFTENPSASFAAGGAATFFNLNQPSLQNYILQTIKNGVFLGANISVNCKGDKSGLFTSGSGAMEQQYCLSVPTFRSFYNDVPGVFNPLVFTVNYFGNDANDNYNSLQAKVRKNFNRGYSFLAHYTWSKGLDYDANYFRVDQRVGYGPDSFDIRHRFVMTNIWDLPIGRGKAWLGGIGPNAERLLGGWTMSAITTWRSGLPFTPSYNQANCGRDIDPGDPCRPNRVGTVRISGSRNQYFTTTGGQTLPGIDCNFLFCGVDALTGQPVSGPPIGPWQRPSAGEIGNAGRNSITGPGFFQSDIGLKVIRLTERTALRFRVDAINAFNKVNLGNPNPCVDCAGGGFISSLAPGALQRELQFSPRIEF